MTGSDDTVYSKNPYIISYNWERDEKIQEKWDSFLTEYNNLNTLWDLDFNPASSYLEKASFQRPYPIVFSEGLNLNDENDCIERALQFYTEWEDLFGCSAQNLEFYNSNISNDWDEFSVRFIQTGINGKHWDFVSRHILYLCFSGEGRIKSIQSGLIPDIKIEKPVQFDKDKIMSNIIGYTYTYHDFTGEKEHTYSRDDTYNFKHEYEIYDKTDGLQIFIYALKGVDAGLVTFYCHPETGAIVFIQQNMIF
ncbi:hypothetical protein ACFL4T_00145 [candidate division KSB1 bacterium]